MKTLLEWLEENRSKLEDGVYECLIGGSVWCGETGFRSVESVVDTTDKYKVENGNISLITPYNQVKENKSASDYLEEGAKLLKERGKQYDKSEEERSMEKIVKIFNLQTGQNLSVVEGWYFMQVLKDVRFFQNTGKPHEDSLVDGINYRALMAEEAMRK
ncbi:hypothetical protein [Proteus mirabilis]|uniref:hypothetical protein n=1 Tax=Proteus mirabilis TaxID=584 RepID=UPI003557FA75